MAKTIQLTQGQQAIISGEDSDLSELKWCAQFSQNYRLVPYFARRSQRVNGRKQVVLLHRVILERKLGRPLVAGEIVDHINGNPLDNRRENLRLATYAENGRNRRKSSNNTSGFKGVSWDVETSKWMAQITTDRKRRYLGRFSTPELAATAYDNAALEMHGEFASLNFVKGFTP